MCARLCHESYRPTGERARRVLVRETELTLDAHRSREDVAVYESLPGAAERRRWIAWNGTNSWDDLACDLRVADGDVESDPRFQINVAWVTELLQADAAAGRRNLVTATGHSLGGSIAMHVAENLRAAGGTRVDCVVFNPGVCRFKRRLCEHARVLAVAGDPVVCGVEALTSNLVWVRPTCFNPHSLRNFL